MPGDAEAVLAGLISENDEHVAAIERGRRQLDERLHILTAERYGLELAYARVRGTSPPLPPAGSMISPPNTVDAPPPGPAAVTTQSEWQTLTRADAIERLLRTSAAPMNRRAIQRALVERGRSEDLTEVSSTLAHLRRYGRAVKVGTAGDWAPSSPLSEEGRTDDALGNDLSARAEEVAEEPAQQPMNGLPNPSSPRWGGSIGANGDAAPGVADEIDAKAGSAEQKEEGNFVSS